MSQERYNIVDASLFPNFLTWQVANMKRFQRIFTVVFVTSPEDTESAKLLLAMQLRDSDILFRFPDGQPDIILMTNTGEAEANVFIDRLAKTEEVRSYPLATAMLEVRNGTVSHEDIMKVGLLAIERARELEGQTICVKDRTFRILNQQVIRVSIIDEDPLVTTVLQKLMDRVSISQLELEIQVFHDGHDFLDSNWYESAHTHIVIMNDVLPKKNGLDILYALRELPNTQKYHIIMMTKRKSETEMLFAYENGVDEYMMKPFNPRLFEAQIKKVLNRIYHE
ncbi:response regulator [Sporosarcina sp. PTS2304]|uniref:response regulator n=1 Tax=Sporosarcina sp. PTS2304 TaxID=2283194 RepID=UPI000E0D6B83|nr:response regulator [Sporosarcina sp. PTS2304]AXI00133.1 response regulator [Sporosarcina sp. PTS2304]